MPEPRWERFRRLCRYYRDCLRFDEHDRLRLRGDHRGDSWASLSLEEALRIAAGELRCLAVEPSLAGFATTAQKRHDWCAYLGVAVLEEHRGGSVWSLPALVLPVTVQQRSGLLELRRDGPLLPNRAALERLFADNQAQQACLERLGLVPAELALQSSGTEEPALGELLAALQEEAVLPPEAAKEALLACTRRGQYQRRLAEELHLLAEATPEAELEASALRLVFAGDRPRADAAAAEGGPLLTEHPLDPAQAAALERIARDELSVVTGPPGTGKSAMVRHLLVNLALRGGSALLASHNHRALDAVEPALNALGRRETLIVRTSHHGHSRSWRHGLGELLEAGDGELADVAAAEGRFLAAQEAVARLEADLHTLAAMSDRHREAATEWSRRLAALPAGLRARLADGSWQGPDDDLLHGLEADVAALRQPGLRRLLPPGEAHRRERVLRSIDRLRRDLDLPRPAATDAADPDAWIGTLQLLREAADCRRAAETCRDLEQRHRRLGLDRDLLLRELASARRRAWESGIALLIERAAAGPVTEEDRQALADLRAAVAAFGLARCEVAYRDRFDLLLAQRPLWTCTNLSAPATLPRRGGLFELLVLDEASQCDIPGIIPLLFRCRRVVAVGDPQQLGPITRLSPLQDERLRSAHGLTALADQRFGYRGTSAWRLLRETPGAPPPLLLRDHYRSHPHIATLFNRAFYRDRLVVRTDPAELAAPTPHGAGVHWHDVRAPLLPMAHGASAPAEADRIAELVAELEGSGYAGSVGIATPFRSQVELIGRRLATRCSEGFRRRSRLLIATAHGFQGDERDCLFFSLCGGEDLRPGAARFLAATPHLFNVAISRARAALHIVGDRAWAGRSGLPFIRELASGVAGEPEPAAGAPETELERQLHEALREAGVETRPQFPVAGRRIDLAVVAGGRRVAIEVDGLAHHATGAGVRSDDDCWRDLMLTEQGWRVLRFWAYEVHERCPDCVARVLQALEA